MLNIIDISILSILLFVKYNSNIEENLNSSKLGKNKGCNAPYAKDLRYKLTNPNV